MSTRTSVAAAGLGLAVLAIMSPFAGAQPAPGSASNPSGRESFATSVRSTGGAGGLATDVAYQTFRSGERAAYGEVGASANESFRSGERAAGENG